MKKRLVLFTAIAFVVGFAAGSFIHFDCVPEKGDLKALVHFKKSDVNENSQLIIQRLKQDTLFQKQTLTSLSIISSIASDFLVNADIAERACEQVPGIQHLKDEMHKIIQVAEDAAANTAMALIAIQCSLHSIEVNVDDALNDAMVSYLMATKKILSAKGWIEGVDEFLKGKNIAEYQQLAFARDQWVNLCTIEAAVSGNLRELDYLEKVKLYFTYEETINLKKEISEKQKSSLALSNLLECEFLGVADQIHEINIKGLVFSDDVIDAASNTILLQWLNPNDAQVRAWIKTGLPEESLFDIENSPLVKEVDPAALRAMIYKNTAKIIDNKIDPSKDMLVIRRLLNSEIINSQQFDLFQIMYNVVQNQFFSAAGSHNFAYPYIIPEDTKRIENLG